MKDQKVLVPLDSSPISAHTVKSLITLKNRFSVPLTLLHVLDKGMLSIFGFPENTRDEFEERVRREARQFMATQKELFSAAGMEVEILIKEGHARETICALADSADYDLLVIGRNPSSALRDILFGQVANFVINQVKCPVLIL